MSSNDHYAYGPPQTGSAAITLVSTLPHSMKVFRTVHLLPVFNRKVADLEFRYQSPYREIHSNWTVDGDKAHWSGTIQPSAKGWLRVTRAEARDTS